ncbi:MAG: hypothetical protein K8R37_16280, partial [Bacteroidales bacterium]|nr:hypothetical protein [Bacteroidales bacterium]
MNYKRFTFVVVLLWFTANFLPAQTPKAVSVFPYSEGFETGLGEWIQSTNDDFNWTRNYGGTPTGNTGPSSAYEGTWYMYTEADNHKNQSSGLYAVFNFNTAGLSGVCFDFAYNMNGLFMGNLTLQVSTNGGSTWTDVWYKSGNQASSWHFESLDLSAYSSYDNVYIRFWSTIGNYVWIFSWSDIAIDDIQVYEPISCIPIPYSKNFDASSSWPTGWSTDSPGIWSINSNWPGATPPTGNHVYSNKTTSGTGTVFTPCFDVTANSNLHVRFYHYWEANTSFLTSQDGYFFGSPDGGTTLYMIDDWHKNNPANEEGWKEYDISSWADGASELIFWWEISGTTWFSTPTGYWVFDDFEIKEGSWTSDWTGNTNTDWDNTGNWSGGILPDISSIVTIPAGRPNYPVVNVTGSCA